MDCKTQNLGELATRSKTPAARWARSGPKGSKGWAKLGQTAPRPGPNCPAGRGNLPRSPQAIENACLFCIPAKTHKMARNLMFLISFRSKSGAAWRVVKNEGRRPEFKRSVKHSSVHRTGKTGLPFCRVLVALAVLCSISAPYPAAAWEKPSWSTSGEFILTKRKASTASWKSIRTEWQKSDGFERSMIGRDLSDRTEFTLNPTHEPIDQLLDLIASAEAGSKGYDAVHHGAKTKPPAPPTELTLAEIVQWINATPGQPHAIGRYQIIPSTLAYLIENEAVDPGATYSPDLQRQFAIRLLKDAGLKEFLKREMTLTQFMDKLAHVWAGLPLASGKSAYEGKAGNRATISYARYAKAMEAIFPDRATPAKTLRKLPWKRSSHRGHSDPKKEHMPIRRPSYANLRAIRARLRLFEPGN